MSPSRAAERTPRPEAVARHVASLHPAEAAELSLESEHTKSQAFARAWARKEAYLKGIGTCLSRDPRLDHVGTGPLPGPDHGAGFSAMWPYRTGTPVPSPSPSGRTGRTRRVAFPSDGEQVPGSGPCGRVRRPPRTKVGRVLMYCDRKMRCRADRGQARVASATQITGHVSSTSLRS
ncbi:4'-phosphopantetheinyl transferase superfamily protein [Streptomyces sp. NBC_00390]|uniref:4'-phosphopantetheinyl transferase superfamily protein n=1 Tax=Streptomyces sp. NBC_00390 TaxID=2975736 RepID=UPI002E1C18B2